jgi:hypothetical protein
MKLELMFDSVPVFAREVDERTKANVERAVTFMTRTQEEVLAERAARRAAALALLPEEQRVEYLRVEALPPDEKAVAYATREKAALEARLATCVSLIDAVSAAESLAKP